MNAFLKPSMNAFLLIQMDMYVWINVFNATIKGVHIAYIVGGYCSK